MALGPKKAPAKRLLRTLSGVEPARARPALTLLTRLESAAAVNVLDLARLPQLADLAALGGLIEAGGITLDELPKLTSLAGLGNLSTVATLTLGGCLAEGEGGLVHPPLQRILSTRHPIRWRRPLQPPISP